MSRVTVLRRALATVCLFGLFGLACLDRQSDESLDAPNPRNAAVDCIDRPVRMAVASSLRELSLSLRQQLSSYDPPIEIENIFGASSAHARQLSLGAPMDVLVSADAEIVDDLVRRGLIVDPSRLEFAYGQLLIVAKADWTNPTPVLSVLENSDFERLAIPSAAVPLGRYARAWLASRNLLEHLDGKIVLTEHARATLAAVDSGLVDLAIVYRSESRLAKNAKALMPIDPSEHPPIRYVAARTTSAPDCASIDEAIAAWGRPTLQSELQSAGFLAAHQASNL